MSCVNSPLVSDAKLTPSNFVNVEITQERAGMLSPSDSVSVANTTLINPSWKSRSTVSFA